MSVATVATTATPTSAGSPSPSSAVLSSSTTVPPSSSSTSSQTTTSADQSTTSASKSSVQPTTTATATATSTSTTVQPPASTSPAVTTSSFITIDSSTPISTTSPTSNTPSATTSPLSTASYSESSSPLGTNIPLTTVLESTTVYVTSTNSAGQVVTSAPPVVTEVVTTTGSGGIPTTVTQAIVNPTLASNDDTTGQSSFFTDKGAVASVFAVVGLASASIVMWILFAIRRRQRMKRNEQDSIIGAAIDAAVGFDRIPLEDDDEPYSSRRRVSSGNGRRSTLIDVGESNSLPASVPLSDMHDDLARNGIKSYAVGAAVERSSSHPEGYIPARTSPLPRSGHFIDELGSSRDRKSSYGHTPTYSAGSFEPLLASHARTMSDQDTSTMLPPRDRSPEQHVGASLGPSEYSSEGSPENKSRDNSRRRDSSDSFVFGDGDDYAHYVLMVRNVPDDQSRLSA